MTTIEECPLPAPWVIEDRAWFCSKDRAVNHVSPRCGIGGSHRQVTVTTTVTITEGWDGGDNTVIERTES